jgi:replicative DNA helicase
MDDQEASMVPLAWRAEEAERAVIGAVIIDSLVMESLVTRLNPRDFFDEALGRLFDFLLDMHTLGEPIGDLAFLVGRLRETKFWVDIGRQAGLAKMATECPNAKHAIFYAAQIREAADRRRLAAISSEFYERLMDPNYKPDESIKLLDAKIATTGFKAGVEAVRISDASRQAIDRAVKSRESADAVGVQTGLYSIDNATGGLFPEELTVLAARPSIGKSALGAQIAYHSASQRRPALFVSLEMAEWELAARTLAAESTVDGRVIRAATLTDDNIEELRSVQHAQETLPLWIWRPQRASVAEIRCKAREIAATSGLALLVVDYLSLVRPDDPRAFRRDQLSQIGKDLKELANELKIPILALAQLNRTSEGERPKLSHLAESGTIEQDANSVWLLHREDRASVKSLLLIEKNRSGPTGDIELEYDPGRTTFRDYVADFQ